MADIIDDANDRLERWLTAQIEEHAYQQAQASSFEIGRCRNCNERIDDGRAFCDESCRNDLQHRERMEKLNRKYRGD